MAIYYTLFSPRITVSFLIGIMFLILVLQIICGMALIESECEMVDPGLPIIDSAFRKCDSNTDEMLNKQKNTVY